ncbi:MAG: DEAD/DEAH box helicase [Polyangiaceae bacterium]|nr:DEAD/DEAH box helicase [Polyangiaceae bacterium]
MNALPPSWSLHHSLSLPGRAGRTVPADGLPLEAPTRRYLAAKYPSGLYVHQEAALLRLLAAEDVCLATPTASGKTAVFHAAALDALARNPKARILALYPMKALGAEQETRWVEALALAGIDAKVGRIDGGVSTGERNAICSRARVLIATPDVVHTWLLPRTGQRGFEGPRASSPGSSSWSWTRPTPTPARSGRARRSRFAGYSTWRASLARVLASWLPPRPCATRGFTSSGSSGARFASSGMTRTPRTAIR